MKISKWFLIWLIVVVSLSLILALEIFGFLSVEDVVANIVLFLVAFIIIAVLAAIGAMFVGVFITHRIFSVQAFTPFEKEMLLMREEVKEIKEKVEALARLLSHDNPTEGPDRKPR